MQIKRSIKVISLFLIIFLSFPKKSFAYLDPGTGSYIIQIIIGGFLGGGYLLKTYWKNIKNLFKKRKSDEKEE